MTQAADRARERLLSAWLRANINQPMSEAMDEVRAAIEAIEAEARGYAKPDPAGGLDIHRLALAFTQHEPDAHPEPLTIRRLPGDTPYPFPKGHVECGFCQDYGYTEGIKAAREIADAL